MSEEKLMQLLEELENGELDPISVFDEISPVRYSKENQKR